MNEMAWLDEVQFDEAGLVAAIACDANDGSVLMLAWMNQEALAETVQRGEAVYYSRSRNQLWHKGETSGHVQRVRDIRLDCDGDAILLSVEQVGGIACHTGRRRCFYRRLVDGVWEPTDPVKRDPDDIYGKS